MKNILLLLVGLTLISCEEDLIQNYQFEMNGRTYQDNNGSTRPNKTNTKRRPKK